MTMLPLYGNSIQFICEMDGALGKAALFFLRLAGESPVVEGKPDHYVASLASPAVTKEMKRRQRNVRAETDG
ncbi:hypothetical protein XNC1_0119 [Xenorhabdus nematophila ATCC 19061]|uniref:Uncharacterized protein n=1 Tax=Xenorhabdus nematophila (strain ATCC 19061 / DSM 3370 / CCUG 14189 / LMG 1036 / NCIMB 9965 / AN6) TaxID=406817 RepID=D3VGB7_XENNA|nr:hypothetical protein XNC1_0119 [Xenorhabdus nematophila ATCC 19061]CEK21125.1 hypothetical protein XNC2_0121 [Xenorhabdus nematophila AN6/1]